MFRKIRQDILQQHGKELTFELYQSHDDKLYLHLWKESLQPSHLVRLQVSNDKKILEWVYPNDLRFGSITNETQGFGIKASPLVILTDEESIDLQFLQVVISNLNTDKNLIKVKEILHKYAN